MDFAAKLENLATLAVRVGNNLQPHQRLFVRSPLEAAPLVRLITKKAYQAGARLVDVIWTDDLTTLERLLHSSEANLSEVSEMRYAAMEAAIECGDAYLSVLANDPEVYSEADPKCIATVNKAMGMRGKRAAELFGAGQVNWSIVSYAIPSWSKRIFPDLPEAEGLAKLWDAIFISSRADQVDPVAAWKAHISDLEARRDFLNTQNLRRLEFYAPGTDLVVELPELHRWEGGSAQTSNPKHATPFRYVPNIPTEEVFTMPHRLGVNGTVRSSKPLSYGGKIIEDITMTFKDGKAVAAGAARNEALLHQLLETDEGASRLGEVALVAESSPVARSGVLFRETLFDENAACHIAQGRAYAYTLKNGNSMTLPELEAHGANNSQVHVDWMIGSKHMDVIGIRADGSKLSLLEQGQWAFKP
ncbi:MAG: aminopeptidase [Deinococcales bacterium]